MPEAMTKGLPVPVRASPRVSIAARSASVARGLDPDLGV
jgi:hypothetical protein